MVWLNVHLFSWILVLTIFLSLWSVMTFSLLHFPVSWWLYMASKTCWNIVGSFLKILKIQTLVLFLSGCAWFHGLLFVDWDIYEMLWCSQYCATIPMGVPLREKKHGLQIYHLWWRYYLRGRSLMLKGWKYLWQAWVHNLVTILTKCIVVLNKFCRWTISEIFCVWVPSFHFRSDFCITHEWSLLCSVVWILRIWFDGVYITSKSSEFMDARIFNVPLKVRWVIV